MKFFERSRGLVIDQSELLTIAGNVAETAYVSAHRTKYHCIHSADLKEWLDYTKIDENIWREAQITSPGMTVSEFVCVEFSRFLVACIEPQERVKQGLPYPLAICSVITQVHDLSGYIDEDREFVLIEPQNDAMMEVLRYQRQNTDNQINEILFS